MRELRKSQCQRVSIKYSIICAMLGLAAAILVFILIGMADVGLRGVWVELSSFISKIINESIIAIATLFASALTLGLVAGGLIYRIGVNNSRIWLIGICLAWSCLILSVLLASSLNFFSELHREPSGGAAFMDWIIKPVFWVVLVGSLPAAGLGLFYAARVKRALSIS